MQRAPWMRRSEGKNVDFAAQKNMEGDTCPAQISNAAPCSLPHSEKKILLSLI